jgi:ubiquitin-protein ligase
MPPNFPASYPESRFLYDFKHYHVFATGTICHPLLKPNGWSSDKSLIELGTSIIHMVHSPPVIGD